MVEASNWGMPWAETQNKTKQKNTIQREKLIPCNQKKKKKKKPKNQKKKQKKKKKKKNPKTKKQNQTNKKTQRKG